MEMADSHHAAVRSEITDAERTGATFVMSAAAYAETLVRPARAGRSTAARAKHLISKFCASEPVAIDVSVAEKAAQLRAEHRWLTTVDALIVATAGIARASEIFTTDKRLARLPKVRYIGE